MEVIWSKSLDKNCSEGGGLFKSSGLTVFFHDEQTQLWKHAHFCSGSEVLLDREQTMVIFLCLLFISIIIQIPIW